MLKLIEYDHLSVDGRTSGDDFWAAQMAVGTNDAHNEYQLRLLKDAVGLVLGRMTYEGFAAAWPSMTGPIADTLNALPKHVASRTLVDTTWNAEVMAGDAVEAVARLKESGDGALVKYGNGPLSSALLDAGLLDELHVSVSPFIAGSGAPLVGGQGPRALDLAGVTDLGNGAVVLAYTPRR